MENKQLIPYLPYGLQMEYIDSFGQKKIGTFTGFNLAQNALYVDNCLNNSATPILKPMELLKDITGAAMSDINTDLAVAIHIWEYANYKNSLHNISYAAYEELLCNHYDVFRLLEKKV